MLGQWGKDGEARQASPENDRQLIEDLLFSAVHEQRRARRWKNVFRGIFCLWLFAALGSVFFTMKGGEPTPDKYVGLVDVSGVIAADQDASADNVVGGLRRAFEDPNVQAVIMRINSPGGSPVQASYIYDEVGRLKGQHSNTKVYAVIADVGASAAYYIAASADEIYADRGSIVGSIGAYMATFGVDQAMEKLGITRRFYGAGDHKALTDPFQPEDPVAAAHLRMTVKDIHEQFIGKVKEGRGERLANDPQLFTGLIWTGQQAQGLGLVDGLGSASHVARTVVGVEDIVDFSVKPSVLERFASRMGASAAATLNAALGLDGNLLRGQL